MKIVVLDGFTVNPGDLSWAPLEALGAMTCWDETPDELRIPRIGDAEIILVNRTPLDRQTIAACPNLKYIGVFATGYNMIDLEAARERGIVVANVPHYSTMAVAQHGMALLLHIANRVCRYDAEVKAGRWTLDADYAYRDALPVELAGLTLGVIGYGAIGRAFGTMGLAMGMEVIATRRNMSGPPEDSHVSYVGKHELLERSDVVSLHVPLTTETEGMIDAAAISMMKDGVIVLNTSRGGLLAEEDVAVALRSGKIGALGTDVTAVEPIRDDNPLLGAPNCFFTPHIAWSPRATRLRLVDRAAENAAAFLAGKPVNVVN
jgi:Lactate dehydrogenase and related dehydrogenases